MTKLDDAIKLLLEEKRRIDAALAALTVESNRPPTTKVEATPAKAPKKPRLSAAARKRIAEAQRKRWAAQKAKAAKSL